MSQTTSLQDEFHQRQQPRFSSREHFNGQEQHAVCYSDRPAQHLGENPTSNRSYGMTSESRRHLQLSVALRTASSVQRPIRVFSRPGREFNNNHRSSITRNRCLPINQDIDTVIKSNELNPTEEERDLYPRQNGSRLANCPKRSFHRDIQCMRQRPERVVTSRRPSSRMFSSRFSSSEDQIPHRSIITRSTTPARNKFRSPQVISVSPLITDRQFQPSELLYSHSLPGRSNVVKHEVANPIDHNHSVISARHSSNEYAKNKKSELSNSSNQLVSDDRQILHPVYPDQSESIKTVQTHPPSARSTNSSSSTHSSNSLVSPPQVPKEILPSPPPSPNKQSADRQHYFTNTSEPKQRDTEIFSHLNRPYQKTIKSRQSQPPCSSKIPSIHQTDQRRYHNFSYGSSNTIRTCAGTVRSSQGRDGQTSKDVPTSYLVEKERGRKASLHRVGAAPFGPTVGSITNCQSLIDHGSAPNGITNISYPINSEDEKQNKKSEFEKSSDELGSFVVSTLLARFELSRYHHPQPSAKKISHDVLVKTGSAEKVESQGSAMGSSEKDKDEVRGLIKFRSMAGSPVSSKYSESERNPVKTENEDQQKMPVDSKVRRKVGNKSVGPYDRLTQPFRKIEFKRNEGEVTTALNKSVGKTAAAVRNEPRNANVAAGGTSGKIIPQKVRSRKWDRNIEASYDLIHLIRYL